MAVSEAVKRGERMLTNHFGNDEWKDRIDLDQLIMSSPNMCVIGQVFQEPYFNSLVNLFSDDSEEEAIKHGFEVGDDGNYSDLTAQWKELLSR